MSTAAAEIKSEILTLIRQYHAATPEESRGDAASLAALIESLLDADLSGGRNAGRFEVGVARLFGAREALLVNSGTAANRVAVSALTSARMGKLRLERGDEVIVVDAGSPSLVTAIAQNGLVPVFVDLALPGFNVDVRQLQAALTSRTRGIALAHLHGNPFDLDSVTMFAAFNNLLLVEDCRDAAGATFGGRPVGCFGQFATASFHPGRQLCTGQGGAVLASTPIYRSIAESLRDTEGSGLRATEMQAAFGAVQLEGLGARLEEWNNNAKAIVDGLAGLAEFFILPESLRTAQPSWLELPIAVREKAPFSRNRLVAALGEAGIVVRPMSPLLDHRPSRQVGSLAVATFAAGNGFLLKVPPAAGQPDAAALVEAVHQAVSDLR